LISSGAVAIVRFTTFVVVNAGLLESVTIKLSGVLFTATVGVPVIVPFAALKFKPAGRVPLVSDQA